MTYLKSVGLHYIHHYSKPFRVIQGQDKNHGIKCWRKCIHYITLH